MKTRKFVPKETSIYMRFMYQENHVRGRKLLEAFPSYSRATIYRHAKLSIDEEDNFDKCRQNEGRPRKLTVRDERNLVREFRKCRATIGSFSASRLRTVAGISPDVSLWTIRRALKRQGYRYLHSRKKGLLTRKDMSRRHQFARKIRRQCCRMISGNLGSASIQMGRHLLAWRKRGEGLALPCTSKGKKAGVEGRTAHFFVSIAYNKGVIACDQYFQRMNGESFSEYVRLNFPQIFAKSANSIVMRFLQDDDPVQNSALAKRAFKDVGALVFSIPPRSPDLNPIENLFHLVSKQLEKDALEMEIKYEDLGQFSKRVKDTIMNFPKNTIDKVIESMKKRVVTIIENRGQRLKY